MILKFFLVILILFISISKIYASTIFITIVKSENIKEYNETVNIFTEEVKNEIDNLEIKIHNIKNNLEFAENLALDINTKKPNLVFTVGTYALYSFKKVFTRR